MLVYLHFDVKLSSSGRVFNDTYVEIYANDIETVSPQAHLLYYQVVIT